MSATAPGHAETRAKPGIQTRPLIEQDRIPPNFSQAKAPSGRGSGRHAQALHHKGFNEWSGHAGKLPDFTDQRLWRCDFKSKTEFEA